MKKLEIKSGNFFYLLQQFTEWLTIMGYAEATVETFPVHVREFLNFLEQKGLNHISQVKPFHEQAFLRHINFRSNQKAGGSLSGSSVNKIIVSVNAFTKFLNASGSYLLDFNLTQVENDVDERTVLTKDEVLKLYDATFSICRQNPIAIGQRDRAMIAVLYGCGLRKDEAIQLNIEDFDLVKNLLFVRKGKGNKQRYVPIARKHAEDIRAYIEEGRYWFMEDHSQSDYDGRTGRKPKRKVGVDEDAFFLSIYGKRMKHFYQRLAYLKEKAGIDKIFSTHSLRHSIATHLLQSGMKLEDIAKMLGHSSLESTTIYTHLANILSIQNEKIELPTDEAF